jgi:hypothetical protein
LRTLKYLGCRDVCGPIQIARRRILYRTMVFFARCMRRKTDKFQRKNAKKHSAACFPRKTKQLSDQNETNYYVIILLYDYQSTHTHTRLSFKSFTLYSLKCKRERISSPHFYVNSSLLKIAMCITNLTGNLHIRTKFLRLKKNTLPFCAYF